MHFEPMLCELAELAQLDSLTQSEWTVERKYDGERIVGQWNNGRVDLWTRRDLDVARRFPEVVSALGVLKEFGHTVVDGELVVGKDLEDLARRQTDERLAISVLSKKMPAKYIVFDVLMIGDKKVIGKPLVERKELLANIFKAGSGTVSVCPTYAPSNSRKQYESFIREGNEGLVAKRLQSKYYPGKRTSDWLKFKRTETIDVDIIGARESTTDLPFGSLIMMRNGKYFGCVGSGFSLEDRDRIMVRLKENEAASVPVEIPKSVVPVILTKPIPAEIKVNAILNDGSPRAPVWVRFRL